MKSAVVIGATSGIGKATAELLAKNNWRLIICGRNEEVLGQMNKIEKAKKSKVASSVDFIKDFYKAMGDVKTEEEVDWILIQKSVK